MIKPGFTAFGMLSFLLLSNSSTEVFGARGDVAPGQSFSYALQESPPRKYRVKVAFVDLFGSPSSSISSLKRAGLTVICYFSAGSGENWRPDYKSISKSALGEKMDEWPGERWLDIRHSSVHKVMKARILLAKNKGCDGVDPDNVDGPENETGFRLKRSDQIRYLEMLSQEARSRGLLIGLKNSPEVASKLEPLFNFAVAEECFKYNECSRYSAFARKQKPIFMIEYRSKSSSLCRSAENKGGTLIFADYGLTRFSFCKSD